MDSTGGHAADKSRLPKFQVSVQMRPLVAYAMAHNHRQSVQSIEIECLEEVSGNLSIDISSRWAAADIPPIRRHIIALDKLRARERVSIPCDNLTIDNTAVAVLEEAAPATLVVHIRLDGDVVEEELTDFTVSARNQWSFSEPEITAAFVQPNHPSVVEVLTDASKILGRTTSSNSLEGYQSGPGRALEIGKAIYEALQLRVHTYIDPPASFDSDGQKVRPIDEVLELGHGTCLDLACAYASVLEQAGLNPILFLVHGHAFTGFLLQERFLATECLTEPGIIRNEIERGDLVMVENTTIPSKVPFEAALESVKAHLHPYQAACPMCQDPSRPDQSHIKAVLDIRQLRYKGILPIPARVRRGDVIELVIDNGPDQPPVTERRDANTLKLLPNTVPARVQLWKNELLDLSMRNSLLNFKPLQSGIAVFPPEGALGAIEDHLVDGGEVLLLPGGVSGILAERAPHEIVAAAPTQMRAEVSDQWKRQRALYCFTNGKLDVVSRAKDLRRKARRIEQDTAVNTLYLTIGSVSHLGNVGGTVAKKSPSQVQAEVGDGSATAGSSDSSSMYTAPLFLVPVRLTIKRGNVPAIELDPNGSTTINYCLLEYLRVKEQLDLKWFKSDMRDAAGLDIEEGLKRLREEIGDANKATRLIVNDDLGIGLLQFEKVRLWKDLDEHWASFAENPVVHHLINSAGLRFEDPANPEAGGAPEFTDTTLWNPMPADSAQTRAIVRALAGHSFILEGPPGTGKSQTITNLLAAALTAKKKVLFVAEKPAALSVVVERLTAVGLDPFCLNMHNKGAKPEEIKLQLRDAMDLEPVAPMDRWANHEREFAAVANALETYRGRLHGMAPAGWSYFDAYLELLNLGDGPLARAGRAVAALPTEEVSAVQVVLANLHMYSAAQPTKAHAWHLQDGLQFDQVDRNSLTEAIGVTAEALGRVEHMTPTWRAVLGAARTLSELNAASQAINLASKGGISRNSDWEEIARARWSETVGSAFGELRAAKDLLHQSAAQVPEHLLIRDLSNVLPAVRTAAASFVLGRKGRLRTALGDLVDIAPFGSLSASTVNALATVDRAGQQYRAAVMQLQNVTGVAGLMPPTGMQPSASDRLEQDVQVLGAIARQAADGVAWAVAFCTGLRTAEPRELEGEATAALVTSIERIFVLLNATEKSVSLWLAERPILEATEASVPEWQRSASRNFLDLQRYLELVQHLRPLNRTEFEEFRIQLLTGEVADHEALHAFQRALFNAILEVIGDEQQFDVFDQFAHDRRIRRFTTLLDERRELLRKVIPATLHSHRTFNAKSGGGTVAALRSELTAKRRGARSVRDLLDKYPEIISELSPCFLMSPDSVAKFLAPGRIKFDLVVFDEASQIPVADAVGAMGRGSAIVIVGDSRQMPPSNTFSAKAGTRDAEFEGDDLESPLESILDEAVEARIGREMLEWHYRSRDESLIAFSNKKFYESRLASFPAPLSHRPDVGIRYFRVNGQFAHGAKGTNPIEAAAMAKEVQRRVHDPELSKFTMGIVTLSKDQMEEVEKALSDLNDKEVTDLLEHEDPERQLLVLNLESVQGRERDVIMLGSSYSKQNLPEPQRSKSNMPLNFGPLTQRGGERRLNVAVTRARREMLVFSSFDPEDMGHAKSESLIRLREYLTDARAASEQEEESQPVADDGYLSSVAEQLEARGLLVRRQLGLSKFKIDLAVTTRERKGQWLLGVLLDNKPWNQRQLVLDRDALPVTFLERNMEWPAIARVWLPAWRRDPDEVLDSLEALVRSLADGSFKAPDPVLPDPELANSIPKEQPATSPVTLEPASERAGSVRNYQAATPTSAGDVWLLENDPRRVAVVLQQIIDIEAPIHADELLKKLARAFGLARVTESRLATLRQHIPRQLVTRTPFGDYVFSADYVSNGVVQTSFNWYRNSQQADRTIDRVAPHEAANLMVELARDAHSVNKTELARKVLEFFGYSRAGADAMGHAMARVNWAVQQGYLTADGDLLRPS